MEGSKQAKSRARIVILGGRSHPEFVLNSTCAGRSTTRSHESRSARSLTVLSKASSRRTSAACDLFIVQSGHANPNDHLMELFFLLDAARRTQQAINTGICTHQGNETM